MLCIKDFSSTGRENGRNLLETLMTILLLILNFRTNKLIGFVVLH